MLGLLLVVACSCLLCSVVGIGGCMLFVVCCLLLVFVVYCCLSWFGVCSCLLFAAGCHRCVLLFFVWRLLVVWLLFGLACWLLFVVYVLVFVVCWSV